MPVVGLVVRCGLLVAGRMALNACSVHLCGHMTVAAMGAALQPKKPIEILCHAFLPVQAYQFKLAGSASLPGCVANAQSELTRHEQAGLV